MKAVQLLMQLLDALQALVLRRRRETKRAEPLHVRRSSSTSDQTESAHQRDWAPDTDRQEPQRADVAAEMHAVTNSSHKSPHTKQAKTLFTGERASRPTLDAAAS